jgi:hypothetical protein
MQILTKLLFIVKGAIRLVNYSKTPDRGVNNIKIDLDGHVIYMGSVTKNDKGFDEGTQSPIYSKLFHHLFMYLTHFFCDYYYYDIYISFVYLIRVCCFLVVVITSRFINSIHTK